MTKITAAADWVSVIGLLSGGQEKKNCHYSNNKIIESLCESCMKIHQPFWNKMSGQSRECHTYCWIKGFTWLGGRQDTECLREGTVKKSMWAVNVSWSAEYRTEPWEPWKGTSWAPPLPPTSTPATQNNREIEKVELLLHLSPSRYASFTPTDRAAGVVTFYCCYLCKASTDNWGATEIYTSLQMKRRSVFRVAKAFQCVHSMSNWTCRPSTVHRQAVSGWSDPQWITGSWPQEFCLPGFNS